MVTAQKIAPLPQIGSRPFWSVMIPTYNCAEYLAQTLQSVLAQDMGPDWMQIEVIDDCSNNDDPEAVVRDVGRGRVAFHRKPKNAGAIANFNSCLERSRGHFVHILHGDDTVIGGYYECIENSDQEISRHGSLCDRCFYIDAKSLLMWISPKS